MGRRQRGLPKSFTNTSFSNSVSFQHGQHGSHVEFSGTSFVNSGPSEDLQMESHDLQAVTTDSGKRDFSNPMYEAMSNMETVATAAAVSGNFAIPSGDSASSSGTGSRGSPASTLAAGATGFMEPPSAILAPSSVTHKSSPQLAIRHKELAPSTVDT